MKQNSFKNCLILHIMQFRPYAWMHVFSYSFKNPHRGRTFRYYIILQHNALQFTSSQLYGAPLRR